MEFLNSLGLIINLSVIAVLVISVLWAMLFKKNVIIRLICVILRAVGALIGTLIFKASLTVETANEVLSSVLSSEDAIMQAIQSSAEIANLALAITGAFISVLVFVLLYFVLGIVAWILRLILGIVFRNMKPLHIGIRAGLGLLQGIIIMACVFVPFSTYLQLADDSMTAIEELGMVEEGDIEEVHAALSDANNCIMLKTHRVLGGKLLSNSLTSIKVHLGETEVKTVLGDELNAIFDFTSDITSLTKVEMSEYTETEKEILEHLGDHVTSSKLLGAIISELLRGANEAWSNGEAYLGMVEKPSIAEDFDPLLDKTLSILGNDSGNLEYLRDDINTFAAIVSRLIEAIPSEGEGESGGVENALMAEGLVKDLLTTVNKNPRMRPLIPVITNIGLSIVTETLGVDADSAEAYNKLTEAIATELKASASEEPDVRQQNMENALNSTLDKLGITNIDASETAIIAMSVISYFDGEHGKAPADVTSEDIDLFLKEMTEAIKNEQASGSTPVASNSVFGPAAAGKLLAALINVQSNNSLSESEKEEMVLGLAASSPIFENTKLSDNAVGNIMSSIAKNSKRNNDKTASAYNSLKGLTPDKEETAFVYTLENIKINEDVFEGENAVAESDMETIIDSVSDVFDVLSGLFTSLEGENTLETTQTLCTELGNVLDTFSNVENFYGEDKTSTLMMTVFKSDKISEFTGMSSGDIKNVLDKKEDVNTSYNTLMDTIIETVHTFDSIKNDKPITTEQVSSLVGKLSTENCGEVVAQIVTPEKLSGLGFGQISESKTESAATLLQSVFTNIASTNETTREHEAEALKQVINIVTQAKTDIEGPVTDAFGENGRLGCEADELVDKIVASTAISKTLAETEIDENPFGLTLSENDYNVVKSEIESRLAGSNESEADVLESLAKFLGVELN